MKETLLSVGVDTGTSSPQTGQPVWGPHVMFTSSAEVNSACGKVLSGGQNAWTRQAAAPRCAGFRVDLPKGGLCHD